MYLASIIMSIAPERTDRTVRLLDRIPQLSLYADEDEDVIVAVTETRNASELRRLSAHIAKGVPGITALVPSYTDAGKRHIVPLK